MTLFDFTPIREAKTYTETFATKINAKEKHGERSYFLILKNMQMELKNNWENLKIQTDF